MVMTMTNDEHIYELRTTRYAGKREAGGQRQQSMDRDDKPWLIGELFLNPELLLTNLLFIYVASNSRSTGIHPANQRASCKAPLYATSSQVLHQVQSPLLRSPASPSYITHPRYCYQCQKNRHP